MELVIDLDNVRGSLIIIVSLFILIFSTTVAQGPRMTTTTLSLSVGNGPDLMPVHQGPRPLHQMTATKGSRGQEVCINII